MILPHQGLAADYSFCVLFNTRKTTFPPPTPPCWKKTKKQDKNSSMFWGGLFAFLQEDKGWHEATGLFPQVLLHEMDTLEKRQSTAGGLN